MTVPALYGPGAVAQLLINQLEAAGNAGIARARAQYDLAEAELPDITDWYPYDKNLVGLEEFPAVMVVVGDTISARVQQRDPAGGDEWAFRYQVQVFLFVRADDEEDVAAQRAIYTTVLRSVLLPEPALAEWAMCLARGDIYTESPSALMVDDQSDATVAGVILRFQVATVEPVPPATTPLVDEVATVQVDTTSVPPAEPGP